MSYTQLIFFKNRVADSAIEYQNSWGGTAMIWTVLFDRYCTKKHQYDGWHDQESAKQLWALTSNKDIPLSYRAALAFTYDNAYVSKKNKERFIQDLNKFREDFKFETLGKVNHLKTWIKDIEEHLKDEYTDIALYSTSVCENPWMPWDSENEEGLFVNLEENEDNKYWEIYEELDNESED